MSCFCAYFSFEVDFSALHFHRVWGFSKMHSRDGESRIIDNTTVQISSTSMVKDSKIAEGCLSSAGRPSKKSPEVPVEVCASGGTPWY